MSKDQSKQRKQDRQQNPPDGRGPRPSDPAQLAKWIAEQVTRDTDEQQDEGRNESGEQPKKKSA